MSSLTNEHAHRPLTSTTNVTVLLYIHTQTREVEIRSWISLQFFGVFFLFRGRYGLFTHPPHPSRLPPLPLLNFSLYGSVYPSFSGAFSTWRHPTFPRLPSYTATLTQHSDRERERERDGSLWWLMPNASISETTSFIIITHKVTCLQAQWRNSTFP